MSLVHIKLNTGKRLPAFRRLDFPDAGFTREHYEQLTKGASLTVDERVSSYLISRAIASEVGEDNGV